MFYHYLSIYSILPTFSFHYPVKGFNYRPIVITIDLLISYRIFFVLFIMKLLYCEINIRELFISNIITTTFITTPFPPSSAPPVPQTNSVRQMLDTICVKDSQGNG